MAFDWLVAVCTEQAIPPWQIEAEIAVGLTDDHGMVHPMHVGCNDNQSQHPVDPQEEPYIAVIKHGRGIQENLENQYRH